MSRKVDLSTGKVPAVYTKEGDGGNKEERVRKSSVVVPEITVYKPGMMG